MYMCNKDTLKWSITKPAYSCWFSFTLKCSNPQALNILNPWAFILVEYCCKLLSQKLVNKCVISKIINDTKLL